MTAAGGVRAGPHRLDTIPFTIDAPALFARLGVERDSECRADLERVLALARAAGRPKALYLPAYVTERGDDTVVLGGARFTSHVLRRNPESVERVFLYIATCGPEFDRVAVPADDMLGRFGLDLIKEQALAASLQFLQEHIERTYAPGNVSSMNPGSGPADLWPLPQQRELFAALGDVAGQIGVALTDTFLMIPNKTVSGLFFPTEIRFVSCQLCERPDCQRRRVPYDPHRAAQRYG